ncbi:MAG TPA: AAA family ATPase [Candidatus Levybacteria bacterium]|nr:AAA family ATPase [Candidatus Levybacteria bacterium]
MIKPQIVGITGAFGSGKSTASDFITSFGYKKIRLSKFLEDELLSSGDVAITRKKLQDLGNSWRNEHGSGVLGKKAVEFIFTNNVEKVVVEGIRNIEEVQELKKIGKVTLIALMVDRNVRYKRLEKLTRREKLTPELFEKLDARDLGLGESKSGLQTALCIALSDIYIQNNTNEKELCAKLEKVIAEIER